MFLKECDAVGNVIEPNTHEERRELWRSYIESLRREDSKVDWRFIEMEMFESYDSSSSSSYSKTSNDGNVVLFSSFPGPARPQMMATNVSLDLFSSDDIFHWK